MIAAPAFAQTTEAAPAQDAPAATQQAAPQEAPAQSGPTADQIKQLVAGEWSKYDLDSSGALEQAEFASWMTDLRKNSEPTFDSASEEGAAWLQRAFEFADKDSNASVSQGEMVTLLLPAAEQSAAAEEPAATETPAESADNTTSSSDSAM
ncbi:calcium-binding protein [Sphingosinithalassobacter portus]|uniref:calcium-binding protein n=1 Tax=Stakelama portus TaxID=2676234 RepID=UPI0011AB64A8|nr:calcium-binding protein [Sphingosinithalassobacter portus]